MAFKFDSEAFYTTQDLEKVGLATRMTIRNWIKTGKLQAVRVGRQYIVKGKDIQEFLSVNKNNGRE